MRASSRDSISYGAHPHLPHPHFNHSIGTSKPQWSNISMMHILMVNVVGLLLVIVAIMIPPVFITNVL